MTALHEIFPFTCRCCTRCELDSSQNVLKLQSLYTIVPGAMDNKNIADILTTVLTTRIVISSTDEMPQSICLSCVESVLQMQKFLNMCIESEKSLRFIIEDAKQKSAAAAALETLNLAMLKKETIIKKKQLLNLEANGKKTEIMLDTAIKKEKEIENFAAEENFTQQKINENSVCVDMSIKTEKYKKNHCTKTTMVHNENIVKEELQIMDGREANVKGMNETITKNNSMTKEPIKANELQTAIDFSLSSSNINVLNEPLIDDDNNSNITNSTFEEEINCDFELAQEQEKDNAKQIQLKSKNKKAKAKKEKPKQPFICNVCNKRFSQKVNLQTHTRIHTGEKPFKCDYCERAFKQNVHLIEHLHLHLGENVYQCKFCPSGFRQNSELRIHSKEHQNENAETRERNLAARKAHQLEIQKNNIPRERTFQCNQCDKKFYESVTLQNHLATHTIERPYKCKYCDYATKNQHYLNNHLRKHLGVNVHLCKLCPLGFRFISELRIHRELHENDDAETRTKNLNARKAYHLELQKNIDRRVRNFECEQCYKRFYKNSMLIKHMQTHTVVKPYQCKYCDYAGINRDYLSKHLRLHLGNFIHMCKICPLDFRLYSELRAHSEVHKNENAEARARNLSARREKDAELIRNLKTKETTTSSDEDE